MYSKVQCSVTRPMRRVVERDLEEARDAPDLARQVLLQIGEVEQQHVGQVADPPPGGDALPERPEGIAVALEPLQKVLADRVRRLRDRWANPARGVVEGLVPGLVGAGVVVVEAPDHVPAVAADVEVFGLGREDQRVHRQVRLHEAPVSCASRAASLTSLGGTRRSTQGDSSGHVHVLAAAEDELAHDLLGPGGARLGVGGNHDVVGPEREIVPDGRIHVVVMDLPRLAGPRDGFRHLGQPSFQPRVGVSAVAGGIPIRWIMSIRGLFLRSYYALLCDLRHAAAAAGRRAAQP